NGYRAYPGDAIIIYGKGFLPNAEAFTANSLKMPKVQGEVRIQAQQRDDEQLEVLVPDGAQTGVITVKQGPSLQFAGSSPSNSQLIVNRLDEFLKQRGDWVAEATLRTPKGEVKLQTDCSNGELVITGSVQRAVSVGKCPM